MSEKRNLMRVIVENVYCAMCGSQIVKSYEEVCEQDTNLVAVKSSLSEAKKISKSVVCPHCGCETPFLARIEPVETDFKEPS
jgi:NMD protein affecting ribosome stability and mRNA decay